MSKKRREKIKIVMPAEGGVQSEVDMCAANVAYSIGMLLKSLAEGLGESQESVIEKILATNKAMAEREAKENE